jgi:hypothetical protein
VTGGGQTGHVLPPRPLERDDALVRGLLLGLAVFRWLGWASMAGLLVVNRTELGEDPAHPALALVLVGLALATTVVITVVPARMTAGAAAGHRYRARPWTRRERRGVTSWATAACWSAASASGAEGSTT